ncbi:hypothetical protein BUALT_Bualt04G0085700 [Buddleja alternifolia]|uniref:Uncharacterized protein n=1 Tax=Buddleja alternifolia TaxID=168488 RepID=A0AAV6XUS9_9LAMI|nr:hypothetical protein BUALT_Bualt04G0085700 [Buddleja alternifolia]
MIKRRFYRYEHGDKDIPSGSSSSSDSEVEPVATDESEEDDDENVVADVREKGEASSSSGLPTSDDDVASQNGGQNVVGSFSTGEDNTVLSTTQHSPSKEVIQSGLSDCVVKCKSVFKCRLCPRIVCLSEDTLKAHLASKANRLTGDLQPSGLCALRHARSEKLLREGRLKLMLNDAGQIWGEAPPDNPPPAAVSEQKSAKSTKKGKGRWKHGRRSRQETRSGKASRSTEKREKRRKNDN